MAVHQGSSLAQTKQILCRYYMHGVCREGENCQYSHDLKEKPSMVCKYYLQGSCSYGNSCRYDHVKPSSGRIRTYSGPKPIPLLPKNDDKREMVSLTKQKSKHPKNWADAAVFVPGQALKCKGQELSDKQPGDTDSGTGTQSYSAAAQCGVEFVDELANEEASETLCPFDATLGYCPFIEQCNYLHGLECEYCGNKCLHPFDLTQQQEHRQSCVESHEKDMQHSFAVQRSFGVTCGICLEEVKSKANPSEQRFGILTDCNHSFCLACIRHWRNTSQSKNKVVRMCPVCRKPSAFVTPSEVWIDDPVEKKKLIEDYKSALREKPCKYFAQGTRTCQFGASCFYKHAYPDGRVAETKLRHCNTSEGNTKVVQTFRLWDFLEALEDERTSAENTIIFLPDSDSDTD
ncbi:probable E3 ubiquitin-protein ligase makorin-1 [Pocillopora verrucosa]|uniref:probable E3 ubiquitin-protein ligase makorin-1 n=1 Tax=Pocillopora verrucosa TaxID=203993 RepID=UPI00333FA77A